MNQIKSPLQKQQLRAGHLKIFQECGVSLASAYCRAEDIGIETIVVTELKFRNIQRHIFFADLVKGADHAALKDRPEALNRIGVNRADNVLLAVMVNRAVRIFLAKLFVAIPSVRREQANLVGHDFIDEIEGGFLGHSLQNASDHVALALYRANDRRFVRAAAHMGFLIPMAVDVFAANKSFVNLDNAAKLFLRLNESRADFVAHAVRGLVATKAHLPLNLERANSFLAAQHQVRDFEPVAERFVGVLKNRARDDGETIAVLCALLALPVPLARRQVIDGGVATARAVNALGPTAGLQIGFARIVVTNWKKRLKLALGHLVNWLRTLCHDGYPSTSTVG
jgi:hypothetical protein